MKIKFQHIGFIIGFITATMLLSCAGPKTDSAKKSTELYYQNIHVMAGNDDTVNVYRLAFTNDNKFLYKIVNKEGPRELTELYDGALNFSVDTIYLLYNKGVQPKGMRKYLIVVDSSGIFFIQNFTVGRKPMILKQKLWTGLIQNKAHDRA